MTLNINFEGHSKIKANGAVEFTIYDFLLVSNSNQM